MLRLARRVRYQPVRRALGHHQHRRSLSSSSLTSPLELIERALVTAQLHTGLPWWATIAGGAVALRVALLPSLWYQLRETRRLVALRPQFEVLRQEVSQIESRPARVRALVTGIYRQSRRAGVQPIAVFGMPILQLPLLVVVLLGVRRLVRSD